MDRRKRVISMLAGAVLVATGAARSADAPSAAATTTSSAVLDWNARAAQLIVGPGGANKAPVLGLIDLAIVHTAIYDAVNAVEGFAFRPYGVVADVPGPASGDAAVAAAGRGTLIALYSGRSDDIEGWYAASLAAIPDGEAKTNGILVGEQAAAGILALREHDGRNDGTPIVEPPAAPGVWVRTPPAFAAPLAPWVRYVTPWNLQRPSQFRPGPPPRLSSARYRRDYVETRDFGGAVGARATAEQQDVGRFWGDQPMLQWNRAWRGIVVDRGLSGMDAARFFAMLSTATSDSLIACWDAKFEYLFWRPVTSIRAGGGDPRLTGDPNWSSLVTTPNHPEYPGAHGCLSGAATSALKRFFRTDSFSFTIDSNVAGLQTPVRSYASFSQAIDEVIDARVWGGMHYRSSSEVGARLGSQVARLAARAFRRACHGHDHHDGEDDEGADDPGLGTSNRQP
jgi:vanadium-dependent haloperoxidase-like protein